MRGEAAEKAGPGETVARRYAEFYSAGQESIEGMVRASNAMLHGLSGLGDAWLSFWNDQASENVRTLRALAECRTLQEALELQNEFARTSLERLHNNTAKSVELTVQMVNNGLGSGRVRGQRTLGKTT